MIQYEHLASITPRQASWATLDRAVPQGIFEANSKNNPFHHGKFHLRLFPMNYGGVSVYEELDRCR